MKKLANKLLQVLLVAVFTLSIHALGSSFANSTPAAYFNPANIESASEMNILASEEQAKNNQITQRSGNWGLFDLDRSYIGFKENEDIETYSVWDDNPGSILNKDFGIFGSSDILELVFYDIKTWKNDGGDVTGGTFYYTIYPRDERPDTPIFTNQSIEYIEELTNPGDQKWGFSGANINLLYGLDPGEYALEFYAEIDGTNPTKKEFDNNLGQNFIAFFEIDCENPTDGGTISGDQVICSETFPDVFTSDKLPSGHNGNLEYQWQISTTSPTFEDIAGAASETYTHAGTITQTTWFRRLARVDCADDWSDAAASNVVKLELETPVVTTNTLVSINFPSAFAGGNIDNPCEATDPVTERGICWSTSENPEHGSVTCIEDAQAGAGSFVNIELTGLVSPQTYYLRAYAITSQGTFYGEQVIFNTGAYNANDPNNPFLSIQGAIDDSNPGDVIRIPGGEYSGNVSTTFAGGVTLYPGDSPTCVTITGTFTVTDGDELLIDIEGTDACTGYTQLTIQGAIDLAGIELVVQLDYMPVVGHSYVIIDNESGSPISGQFDQGTSFVEFYDVYQITFVIEYDHETDNVRLVVSGITDLSAIPIGNPALYLSILLIAGFIVFRRFIGH